MNFGGKFSFKGNGNAFRTFFRFNNKKNFSLFKSQPTLVNIYNGLQKRNYYAMAISSSMMMSLCFLSNGSMTNVGAPFCLGNKNFHFLETLEELILLGELSVDKSRYFIS